MKTFTIGGKSYAASMPADIDSQLAETSGCGVREIDTILAAGNHRAAMALHPLLGVGAPPIFAIARAIASGEVVIDDIRTAYAETPKQPPVETKKGG